ncbi:MAG: glycosyltransferase family 2 protein [Clostridium sp.]
MISIIVPTHNNEKYIECCLNSITNQQYKDLEVIVIVNASNDDSYRKSLNMAKKDKRIKVIQTDEGGVSNARNIGLKYANGDIIGFCDADDYLSEDILLNVEKTFKKEFCDIVVFGYNYVNEEGKVVQCNIENKNRIKSASDLIDNVLLNDKVMGSVWNKYFRRELLSNFLFNKELSYCEDCNFLVKVLANNIDAKIHYIEVTGYNYRINLDSATKNYSNLFDNQEIKYVQAIEQIRNECVLNRKNTRSLNTAIVKLSLSMYYLLNNNPDFEVDKRRGRMQYIFINLRKYIMDYIMSSYISIKNKIKLIYILLRRKA